MASRTGKLWCPRLGMSPTPVIGPKQATPERLELSQVCGDVLRCPELQGQPLQSDLRTHAVISSLMSVSNDLSMFGVSCRILENFGANADRLGRKNGTVLSLDAEM